MGGAATGALEALLADWQPTGARIAPPRPRLTAALTPAPPQAEPTEVLEVMRGDRLLES
jgi:hypothetical protein